MSSTMRMWMEIAFNVAYLLSIWILVAKMFKRIDAVKAKDAAAARSVMLAFVLLAAGDTGHVGFRVLSYYIGSLGEKLVGLGALATAVTITFFYIIMLDVWRKRYKASYGAFEYLLIIAGITRLIMFIHPGNQWLNAVPPYGWSLTRNIPLILQGLGVAYLMLRDSFRYKDGLFKAIGILILLSYAFYAPVIFLVQKQPSIGMLMIPKTLAYIAIGIIAYKGLFAQSHDIPLRLPRNQSSIGM